MIDWFVTKVKASQRGRFPPTCLDFISTCLDFVLTRFDFFRLSSDLFRLCFDFFRLWANLFRLCFDLFGLCFDFFQLCFDLFGLCFHLFVLCFDLFRLCADLFRLCFDLFGLCFDLFGLCCTCVVHEPYVVVRLCEHFVFSQCNSRNPYQINGHIRPNDLVLPCTVVYVHASNGWSTARWFPIQCLHGYFALRGGGVFFPPRTELTFGREVISRCPYIGTPTLCFPGLMLCLPTLKTWPTLPNHFTHEVKTLHILHGLLSCMPYKHL